MPQVAERLLRPNRAGAGNELAARGRGAVVGCECEAASQQTHWADTLSPGLAPTAPRRRRRGPRGPGRLPVARVGAADAGGPRALRVGRAPAPGRPLRTRARRDELLSQTFVQRGCVLTRKASCEQCTCMRACHLRAPAGVTLGARPRVRRGPARRRHRRAQHDRDVARGQGPGILPGLRAADHRAALRRRHRRRGAVLPGAPRRLGRGGARRVNKPRVGSRSKQRPLPRRRALRRAARRCAARALWAQALQAAVLSGACVCRSEAVTGGAGC